MNELIEFLTSKEIIVVYIVVAVACLLCFIIYLFDKNYYKRKRRQNTKELNKLVESVNKELEKDEVMTTSQESTPYKEEPILEPIVENVIKENVSKHGNNEPILTPVIEPVMEPILIKEEPKIENVEPVESLVLDNMPKEESVESLEYTSIEPDPKEAQEELQRLTETLEKAEEETRNIDLTSFEEEQEQNAIISLDELLQKSKSMYENNEFAAFEDEGNEPISLKDLEEKIASRKEVELIEKEDNTIKEPIQEKMILDEFNNIKIEEPPVYQKESKFKTSPVISPVFGIERIESNSNQELELENTANYEKLDEEIKKTNEFLMTLKELQKKLD